MAKEAIGDMFWMIFIPGAEKRTQPAKTHFFKDDAIHEAKRLGKKYPDHKVYLLEVVGHFTVEPAPVKFTDYTVEGKPRQRTHNHVQPSRIRGIANP